jgi:hypothetical protein
VRGSLPLNMIDATGPTRRFCFGKTKFVLECFLSTSSLPGFRLVGLLERSSEDENSEIAICGLEPVTAPGGGMRCGGVWNVGERGPAGRKIWKAVLYGLRPLQPLEIPQNRQSFLWKSLAKTT